MKLRNDTERRIYAAAWALDFDTAHRAGPQACHRAWAEEQGREVVECWEGTIAAQAIETAEATIHLYRKGQRQRAVWNAEGE